MIQILSVPAQDRPLQGRLRMVFSVAAMAAIFAGLAYGGIELTRGSGRLATLWLPNAILAGTLLRTRRNTCPFYLAACLLANVAINRIVGDGWTTASVLAVANAIEVTIVIWTMRRLCGRNPEVSELRTLGWLLVVCILAPTASGMIAAAKLAATGELFSAQNFVSWVLADGLSLMIVTPIVMIGIDAWRSRRSPTRRDVVEWCSFLLSTIAATSLIFAQSRFPFLFLACPIVILAAFRTGITGTAVAIALISLIASAATMFGSGPIMLVHGDLAAKVITLQAFLATSFAMGLPVAVALAGRAAIRRELQVSRDFNRSTLDNVQEIIFRTNAEGRWVFLNPAWEAITGYSIDESLGWNTTKILHKEDIAAAMMLYPKLATGELSDAVLHQRFLRATGECRHIEVKVRRLCDENGVFTGTAGNIRDVSERVQLEREMAESEARFRRMAEAAPVGIFRADSNGRLTYVNAVWCAKIGMTVEDALGTGWMRALVDPTQYQEDPAFTGFHKPGDVRRRTTRFHAAGGGEMWVETVNAAEFDENGVITGFVGAINDITEQRRATEKLIESERRFQALANLAPAGIFRTDTGGNCTYVNAAWLRITGLADDDWQGGGWAKALHPEDAQRVFDGWANAVLHRIDYRAEFRWVRPDGLVAWTDVSARPELDDDGHVLGFIGVTMDITERYLAELELAKRDEQFSLLAKNATDAVFRLTLDGHCIYASPSARSLLGIESSLLVGVQMLDRFHPDDAISIFETFAALARGERNDQIIAYRSELLLEPGTYRWLEAHCGLVRDESGAPREIIASIRDISKTKALEADLRQARERAEMATAAKAAFLANMSHEIRTPMNGVLGFTELLGMSELNSEQQRNVQLIGDSGRAMMRLLNDILDMSKIDAGQMQVLAEPIDLAHKVHNCARLMEPVAQAKGVALTITIDPALPAFVMCDPLRIGQVLLNLVGNAVKFTDQGTVAIRALKDRDQILLEVSDSGVGISSDRLDMIFQQFSQADASIARRFGGTGLGLSISNELVKLMGGTIEVMSEPGRGATFTVRIPLIEALGPVLAEIARPHPTQDTDDARGTRKPRVLIAEDHDINQVLITAMAEAAGFDPTIAADGAQAVSMVQAAASAGAPFELVLMDMQMPIVDGLEATRQLRNLGFTPAMLPIVALTANAYAEDVQACKTAGMQDHLAKPIRQRDLVLLFNRLVG